jgi:hypothetical protein
MITFERRAVRGLRDRHARVIGQQLLHETGMRGIEVCGKVGDDGVRQAA